MLDELKTAWFCSQVSTLKNSMYALAIGILKNETDAEDAIQNTLLSAYEHLEDLRFFEKVKPWILKILTRECYRIASYRKDYTELDDCDAAAPQADWDMKMSVWDAVSRLETKYREIIVLFYYEDLSTREISRILDLSEENVRKRLSRARSLLRTLLDKEDFT
ncbi:MAG: sigma-70 family RNA polymerase sigma factor [Firmicutes bacterium]|nr:sigma-70 family RNA polymerase sigma factor [Bacillota bacterium]